MISEDKRSMIVDRLRRVLKEMGMQQSEVAAYYPPEGLSLADELAQIDEFLGLANELGAAYECIVANLETVPFVLSSPAALALLEAGLLMRYKTDREEDAAFDFRG
jgi:hypothetical protein